MRAELRDSGDEDREVVKAIEKEMVDYEKATKFWLKENGFKLAINPTKFIK